MSTINARPYIVKQTPKDSLIFPVISEMFRLEIAMSGNEKHRFTFFDAAKLPVFCKIEHRIEQKSKIPFRFRLGNLNYVNMLENKE
ncbi:MAG: hypothetical protein IPM42_03255 [Saprospiraceae bacterium]|nr:hypothetical protein [Saprospiraceae bacterium]